MRTLVFLGLFLALPLAELYFLIAVGSRVGALSTIALCLATAIGGSVLVRLQGLGVIARVSAALAREELPARELLEGAALLLAGLLLIFPGFLTDALGFLLLVPALRRALLGVFLRRRAALHPPPRGRVYDVEDADYRVLDAELEAKRRDPRR